MTVRGLARADPDRPVRHPTLFFAFAIAFATSIGVANAQTPPVVGQNGDLRGALGMTLYTYAPDGTSGTSHCTGPCAAVWPPYLAGAGATANRSFGVVTRPDHTLQWSHDGRPLYRYAADTAPGMAKGDGVNGVWHVARTGH